MTVEELDALFEEAYKKRQKSRCITLSFAGRSGRSIQRALLPARKTHKDT